MRFTEPNINNAISTYRVGKLSDALDTMLSYSRKLQHLESLDRSDVDNVGSVTHGLVEHAYRFESAGRSILAELLDTINDVRDAGDIAKLFDLAFQDNEMITSDKAAKQLGKAIEEFERSGRPDIARLCGFAKTTLADWKVELRRQDTVATFTKIPQGVETARTQRFSTVPLPWQAARVSSEEFLNTGNGARALPMIIGPVSPAAADLGHGSLPDFYTLLIKGIGIMSQDLYRHARETEELGPFVFRAHIVPLIAAIIVAVLVVAGAVCLLIGYLTKNDFLKELGWVLISLGMIVFGTSDRDPNATTIHITRGEPIDAQP